MAFVIVLLVMGLLACLLAVNLVDRRERTGPQQSSCERIMLGRQGGGEA